MLVLSFRGPRLFFIPSQAVLNGLARAASHLVASRVERIANACDVAGLLAARRARRLAGYQLFRAAGRGRGWLRRGGRFGCFNYLSELS
ncbi:hypothetical protein ACVIJ6_004466 [Bradyrhizobium sp. USDA 4369]